MKNADNGYLTDKLLKYFSENRLLINIVTLSVFILGVFYAFRLTQDLFPTASLDQMVITAVYPGASPDDVELNAVIPIERKLKSIRGIKEYFSFSVENTGRIVVVIDDGEENTSEIKDEIYREMKNVPDLADEVEEIRIFDANPKLRSVYEIGIHAKKGTSVPERELFEFAEKLEDRILKVDGVSNIYKEGISDREIHIDVLPAKMQNYYISFNDIISSIRSRNVRMTGGTLSSGAKDKTVVSIGQFDDPMDVKEVIIRSNFEQNRIRISDIAKVSDTFKKKDILVKVNSEPAVILKIVKRSNADIVRTVKNVRSYLRSIGDEMPQDIEITDIYDDSLSISSLLRIVRQNAYIGFFLVFFTLFVFLRDIRTSLWTAFVIPITVFATLIFMKFAGYSINIISLAGLVVVLGMLVDHGIVVSEVIHDYRVKGFSPSEAAVRGIKDIFAPLAVTIVTTIVAFIPMFSIKGMMGKFIYIFPSVVIFAITFSFLEAIFILPNHLSYSRRVKTSSARSGPSRRPADPSAWFDPFAGLYEKTLLRLLKHRYLVILAFLCIFVFTIIISIGPIRNFILLDDRSSDQVFIKLEAPLGTGLAATEKFTRRIEDIVNENLGASELMSIKTVTGHHTTQGLLHKGNHDNWALVVVNLTPMSKRKRTADDIINDLRKITDTAGLTGFEKIMFEKSIMGPPSGEAVDIKIIGDDHAGSGKLKEEIKGFLAGINGVIDIDDDQKEGKEELKLVFDHEKMARLGINASSVARTVRTAYEGVIATSIQGAGKKLDFRVKIDDSYKKNEAFLLDLTVPNSFGRLIRLGDFASLLSQRSKSIINHYNGSRVVTVTAGIIKGSTTPSNVMDLVRQRFAKTTGPDIELKFGGEAKETKDTFKDLSMAFIIALILNYFVLVLLFKSLGQPFIVMLTIPFGVVGAMLAFIVHGVPLSFLGVIGVIGLSGVVVNDAVIMVDFINKVFSSGKRTDDIKKLIVQGAKRRLRPVMLTTLTTIAGLAPTVYGLGGDAGMLVPIVMGIAYGLLFSTLLTLIFIPCLYLIRVDINQKIKKLLFRN